MAPFIAIGDLTVFSGLIATVVLSILLTLSLVYPRWLKVILLFVVGLALLGVALAPKASLEGGWLLHLTHTASSWGQATLVLLGVILLVGVGQTVISPPAHRWWRSANLTLGLASIYLWLFVYLYEPGFVLLGLTFVATLVWAAAMMASAEKMSHPTLARWSATALMLIGLTGIFFTARQIGAAWHYRQGNLELAAKWGNQATYDRALADFKNLAAGQLTGEPKVAMLNEALAAANRAVAKNPSNFANWLSRGDIYRSMLSLGIADALARARADYEQALLLASDNQTVLFDLAALTAAASDVATARQYLARALSYNPDFTPALFLSGYLDYQAGNWDSAIVSLGRLVAIAPNYSDARYFLGLSYRAAGRVVEAKQEFEQLLKLNPGNDEVKKILDSWSKKP
ncbi:MAG: tetratricopeptide repeat protein [Candidatus Vogelbacteria bacterium]|nr:tetratricopeptide repeat protein [Candidatus Vogelbacteria bacterium]